MRYPRGDGETILNQPGDILRARRSGNRTGGKMPYTGTFEVTIENGLLDVAAGWLNRNGAFINVPPVSGIAADASGYLCLCSSIIDDAWTIPEYRITVPAADAYPVAEITINQAGGVSIRQLPVAVAIIMLAQVCPMAEF